MIDSGNVYDTEYSGGRLGVYCLSQEQIIWSQLEYTCGTQSVTINEQPPWMSYHINLL